MSIVRLTLMSLLLWLSIAGCESVSRTQTERMQVKNRVRSRRPVVDIFVRTWKQDVPFLAYMLRSVDAFIPKRLYRHIIISYDQHEHDFFAPFLDVYNLPIRLLPDKGVFIRPPSTIKGDLYNTQGYMMQMVSKYMPWRHSDADYFMHLDSDIMIRRPINKTDIMDDAGRVYYNYVNFSTLSPAQGWWQQPSEELLQEPVPLETMTGFPFVFPRDLYPKLIRHVERVHGAPFYDVLRSMERFNEFTPMGHYLITYMPDRCVHNAHKSDAFEQVHSYDGLSADIVARFERYLRQR